MQKNQNAASNWIQNCSSDGTRKQETPFSYIHTETQCQRSPPNYEGKLQFKITVLTNEEAFRNKKDGMLENRKTTPNFYTRILQTPKNPRMRTNRKGVKSTHSEITVKNNGGPRREGSPGWLCVPNRIIFKRKVVHVAIHIINNSVFIQELRLFWVNRIAAKDNIFAAKSSWRRIS